MQDINENGDIPLSLSLFFFFFPQACTNSHTHTERAGKLELAGNEKNGWMFDETLSCIRRPQLTYQMILTQYIVSHCIGNSQ